MAPKIRGVITLSSKKICILFGDDPTTHAFCIIFFNAHSLNLNFLDLKEKLMSFIS